MTIWKFEMCAALTAYAKSTYWQNAQKKFCVGCKCRTNFKFLNRHNLPPNGAKESKIPPFDSKSKTLPIWIIRFFRKKSTFPLCVHFTILNTTNYKAKIFLKDGSFLHNLYLKWIENAATTRFVWLPFSLYELKIFKNLEKSGLISVYWEVDD